MKEISKTDGQILTAWLESLPVRDYKSTIEKIVVKCFIKKSTLSNWRYDLCKIPPLAKVVIEEIANKKIFSDDSHNTEN
jgi:hypothetical protein